MKRTVSDEEYRQALADPDNRRLLWHFQRKFYNSVPQMELCSCVLVALWRALASYDDSLGQKFTTSLYRYLQWECLEACRREKRYADGEVTYALLHGELVEDDSAKLDARDLVGFALEGLSADDRRLVSAHFIEYKGLGEIAEAEGLTIATISARLRRALARLRCILQQQ